MRLPKDQVCVKGVHGGPRHWSRSGGAPRPELGIADGRALDGVGGVKQQELQACETPRGPRVRASAEMLRGRPLLRLIRDLPTAHPSPHIHHPFIAPPAYPTLCRYSSSPNTIDLDFQPGRDHFSLHCPKFSEWGHSRMFGVVCVN
jgi:hypothetical protein